MTNPREHYNRLTSLTMLHLLQEHSKGEWITSDDETCEFFRKRLQPQAAPKPIPKAPTPLPPPPKPIATPPPPKAAIPAPVPPPPAPKQPEPEQPKPTVVVEEAPKTAAPTDKPFTLTSHTPKPRDGMDDWKRILTDVAPKLERLDTPTGRLGTNDSTTASVWIVASRQMPPAHISLLKDLCRAITMHHAEASLIDYEQLKVTQGSPALVIVSSRHQQVVQDRAHVVVPELETLMENPDQKAMLWADICKRM